MRTSAFTSISSALAMNPYRGVRLRSSPPMCTSKRIFPMVCPFVPRKLESRPHVSQLPLSSRIHKWHTPHHRAKLSRMGDRTRARELADEFGRKGDHTGWFEALYQEAEAGKSVVPWADLCPNPHLLDFWRTHPL